MSWYGNAGMCFRLQYTLVIVRIREDMVKRHVFLIRTLASAVQQTKNIFRHYHTNSSSPALKVMMFHTNASSPAIKVMMFHTNASSPAIKVMMFHSNSSFLA
jgi:hypothetical protein